MVWSDAVDAEIIRSTSLLVTSLAIAFAVAMSP
jgi:hypothetical protein